MLGRCITLVLCLATDHRFVGLLYLFRLQMLHKLPTEGFFQLFPADSCRLGMFSTAPRGRLLLYSLTAAVFRSVLVQFLLLTGTTFTHIFLQFRPVLCCSVTVLRICLCTHLREVLPNLLVSLIGLFLQRKDRCRVVLCLRRQVICFLTQHV